MPEVNAPQQQQPMELAPADSAVVTQQPVSAILPVISAFPPLSSAANSGGLQDAQEQMNTDMSLRGGCGETIDCCGMTESCGCC
jgi:hypothetical protein